MMSFEQSSYCLYFLYKIIVSQNSDIYFNIGFSSSPHFLFEITLQQVDLYKCVCLKMAVGIDVKKNMAYVLVGVCACVFYKLQNLLYFCFCFCFQLKTFTIYFKLVFCDIFSLFLRPQYIFSFFIEPSIELKNIQLKLEAFHNILLIFFYSY